MNCKASGRTQSWYNRRIYRYLLRETEENHRTSQNSRCLDRDANPVPPDFKSGALPLGQPVRSHAFLINGKCLLDVKHSL
jgi:hypothetical protein